MADFVDLVRLWTRFDPMVLFFIRFGIKDGSMMGIQAESEHFLYDFCFDDHPLGDHMPLENCVVETTHVTDFQCNNYSG